MEATNFSRSLVDYSIIMANKALEKLMFWSKFNWIDEKLFCFIHKQQVWLRRAKIRTNHLNVVKLIPQTLTEIKKTRRKYIQTNRPTTMRDTKNVVIFVKTTLNVLCHDGSLLVHTNTHARIDNRYARETSTTQMRVCRVKERLHTTTPTPTYTHQRHDVHELNYLQ